MNVSGRGPRRRALTDPDELETLVRVAAALPGAIFQYRLYPDGHSCFPYMNPAAEALTGVPPALLRHSADLLFDRIHRGDINRVLRSIQHSAETMTIWREEGRLVLPDGDVRWLEGHALPSRMNDGGVLWHGFLTDVTARREAEDELRVAAVAFETHEAMLVSDRWGRIIRANRAFTELTGYRPAHVLGQSLQTLVAETAHGSDYLGVLRGVLLRSGRWSGELWCERVDGSAFPAWVTVTAVRNEQHHITHYVAAAVDITDRKRMEDGMRALAYRDPLTGLPNRRLLDDRLELAMASAARYRHYGALLFIDLDDFKRLNDSWGHDMGDQLLVEAARRLERRVRETDTVARLGGDEFVVMLTGLGPERAAARDQALTLAEKLRHALSQPYVFDDPDVPAFRSSCSIGVSLFGDPDLSRRALFKQADIALYQAKQAGRNRLSFHD
ncbi:MAG: diguanylate cyclase [Ectothiorhodospiraceae bacterium]|nr:diguanylate cyclase [Ectothiorhodospiraceae bacterium]